MLLAQLIQKREGVKVVSHIYMGFKFLVAIPLFLSSLKTVLRVKIMRQKVNTCSELGITLLSDPHDGIRISPSSPTHTGINTQYWANKTPFHQENALKHKENSMADVNVAYQT